MLLFAVSIASAYDIKEELPVLPLSQDQVQREAGTVSLTGVVEVPLYADDYAGDHDPLVEVIGPNGDAYLFYVSYGGVPMVMLSSTFIADHKLEAKNRNMGGRKGIPVEVVSSVELKMGDASFENVTAVTSFLGDPIDTSTEGLPFGGFISLDAFPELAFAILPSEGVVRLAPASQASELAAAIDDGETLEFSLYDGGIYKEGRDYWFANPHFGATSVGTFNDLPGTVLVTNMWPRTGVTADLLNTDPVWVRGERGLHAGTLELGDFQWSGLVEQLEDSTAYKTPQIVLGTDVTGTWDIAYDPAGTFTFGEIDSVAVNAYDDKAIEDALKALEPSEDPEELDNEPGAAAYAGVASTYGSLGKPSKRVEYALKALEADEDKACTSYAEVGDAYRQQREWEKAREYYLQALEIYDVWGNLEPSTRAAILEDKAKVEAGIKIGPITLKKPGTYEGYSLEDAGLPGDEETRLMPQAHQCDEARAYVVIAETILDNPSEADRRWKEERDVEYKLGRYAALSYISQGRYDEALSAYQWATQAGKASYFSDEHSALGMALVHDRLGRRDQAMTGYEQALWTADDDDLLTTRAYAMAVASRQGRVAAAERMGALAAANAQNGTWALVWAENVASSGQDATDATNEAIRRLERELVTQFDNAELRGTYAAALLRAGRTDDARSQATKALEYDRNVAVPHLVLGDLATLAGDGELATSLYAEAASRSYWHPMLAVFL